MAYQKYFSHVERINHVLTHSQISLLHPLLSFNPGQPIHIALYQNQYKMIAETEEIIQNKDIINYSLKIVTRKYQS